MSKRICILTAGQLSTCPRMLKAADALYEAGYDVTVVSTSGWAEWADEADRQIGKERKGTWNWRVVDWRKHAAPTTHFWSAIRFRLCKRIVAMAGMTLPSMRLLGAAYQRINSELIAAANSVQCDFFYGGGGALVATLEAAARGGVPFALDLEDFHSAEQDASPSAQFAHALVEQIEYRSLPRASFLTTASDAMNQAYREKYSVRPITINNVFPLPKTPPTIIFDPGPGLRIYWFSQTIGRQRGLEDAVRAMGLADLSGELILRGVPIEGYLKQLSELARREAPRLKVLYHPPALPSEMVNLTAGIDVGLALEQGHNLNRSICLTNKAFTYMLGGLAIAFTDTPGQRGLAEDLGSAALLYPPGDVKVLAAGLKFWADDRRQLMLAKEASWAAARRRWHWEHVSERGRLLDAVGKVFIPNINKCA